MLANARANGATGLRATVDAALDRHGWALPAILCAGGAALRLAWLVRRPNLGYAEGEAVNVAIALVENGYFGDPYGLPSGPTAHLTPSMSLVLAAIYRLFGVRSDASELILALLSIAIVLGAGLAFYAAARAAGWTRLWAAVPLAIFSFAPLNLNLEVIYFRAWEGGLAVLVAGLALLALMRAATNPSGQAGWMLAAYVLCAMCFFVNPAMGVGIYACLGWFLLTRVPIRRWAGAIAAAALTLAVVFAPWVIRNQGEFDRFIPLRSNFGLELAIANHEDAVSGDPKAAFINRMNTIHPYQMDKERAAVVLRNGEIAYAKGLQTETTRWIEANPSDFATLCLRHLREYYFPPAWHWTIYSDRSTGTALKQAIVWGVTGLGLIGAFLALFVWRGLSIYLAILALVPSLPYMIAQPILRYRYLVLLPLLFLAVATIRHFAQLLSRKFRPGPAV